MLRGWGYLLVCLLLCVSGMSKTVGADPTNPKPAEGDLVLPMPQGLSMVFRPVFIGAGDKPFALKKFQVGDPGEDFRENLTNALIGGAFKAMRRGRLEWLYYLGKYEVTEAQYDAIMAPQNPRKDSQKPVRGISWFEAQEFINKYNLWLFQEAKQALPRHEESLGYVRLPTEIEWEFAARGGVEVADTAFKARHPYTQPLTKHEWFAGPASSHGTVKNIGVLEPNALFIHDMLGNVAEMTLSLYQIEYYQGRVGGFVSRGGSYTTEERKLRVSLRSEQPFYGRDLAPHKRPDLGLRLAVSGLIFTSLNTAQELQKAWPDYRQGGVGATAPAAVSIAPAITQTAVQLGDALKIVDGLLGVSTLSQAQRRDLEILRASFGNIEATLKKAEVNDAYAWVEIATTRALYIHQSMKKIPVVRRSMEIAKEAGITAQEEALRKSLNDIEREARNMLNEYVSSIKQLDGKEKESIRRAIDKYKDNLKVRGEIDRIKILNNALMNHIDQYNKNKRADVEQWRADLEKI